MSQADIDDPGNAERIFAAMKVFLAKNTVGGVIRFPSDGPNYNLTPIPVRLLQDTTPAASDVVVRFDSIEHFKSIHKMASEFEEALESKEIDDFNKSDASFKAWPLLKVPEGDDVEMWVILVESKPNVETRIPSVGESCQLRLVDPHSGTDISAWWNAKRTYNNFGSADNTKQSWSKLIAFNVTLVKSEDDTNTVINALIPDNSNQQEALDNLVLDDSNAVHVGLFFTKSDATFAAEMKSLSKIVKASSIPPVTTLVPDIPEVSEEPDKTAQVKKWLNMDGGSAAQAKPKSPSLPKPKPINPRAVQANQVAAFKYLLNFQNPDFTTNIFELYPHMRRPNMPGSGIPPALMKKYSRMNEHQLSAYEGLLSKMPCGLALLPGGPGGGKTDWVMTVVGLMQSKSRAKVLYMLDINDPLDDATAKYIRLMKNAGLKKRAIRMKNFGTELRRSIRVGSMQSRAKSGAAHRSKNRIVVENSDEPEVDFSKNFLSLYTQHAAGTPPMPNKTRHQHIIPTLDEAAWDHYDKCKADFSDLTDLLETCNDSAVQNRTLRSEIYNLYAAVLRQADFIATTPCVAASAFNRMFTPDLVVFDEAAHARELSTLIAIANFCPKAGWIFIGDHRQTQPTVKSNNVNPHGKQLATSAMERAYMAGALEHQLLINHRAYGRLERLPSKLIYDGKMKSGIPFEDRFPRWANFVRGHLEEIAGQRCSVPRLVVHLNGVDRPVKVGTSWYHPQHTQWTMERVLELIRNQQFRSAENEYNQGTILLLAPYKAAIAKYQEAIEELDKKYPNLRVLQRVEARTWDSSQGHEADIVGIDYVRDYPTGFMDGMYRFNVGLTRARQGEWHLMHPDMPKTAAFAKTNYLRKLYSACGEGLDGVGEGRIANLVWGAKKIAVPAQVSSKHPVPRVRIRKPSDGSDIVNTIEPLGADNIIDGSFLTPNTLYTSPSSVNSQVSLTAAVRDISPETTDSNYESGKDSAEPEPWW